MATVYTLAPIKQDAFTIDARTNKPVMTPDWIRWYISVDGVLGGLTVIANGNFGTLTVSGASSLSGPASFGSTVLFGGAVTFINSVTFTGPSIFSNSTSFTGPVVFSNSSTFNGVFVCNTTPTFNSDINVAGKFGCNGKAPQASVVSDGTLAKVIATLIANGIMV